MTNLSDFEYFRLIEFSNQGRPTGRLFLPALDIAELGGYQANNSSSTWLGLGKMIQIEKWRETLQYSNLKYLSSVYVRN